MNNRVAAALEDRPGRHAGQSSAGNPVYSCFDFRLASDLPLDDLALAHAGDRRPVVVVRVGPVIERLPDSKEEIDGLLEFLDANHLGWSSAMAPVIMANADRPELAEELANSCR